MNGLFNDAYKGKSVLITGHTGFKGSWLSLWLTFLGANVIGYSLYLPSEPCNFIACGIDKHVVHIEGDVCDIEKLRNVFSIYKPEIVFHLAAQPIVEKSYGDPKLTFDTNIGGTVNVLECIRTTPDVKAVVIITSDKCYRNMEWTWGYRENDILGGDDPYSASKACAEMVCNSYSRSFFYGNNYPRIASARAGNVIGGGDWADARVIPDCVRAWSSGSEAVIYNPESTRPWQHVLEPLSGYLWLGTNLLGEKGLKLSGEAFNFGPEQRINKSVAEVIETFLTHWGSSRWRHENRAKRIKESGLLKLSCDKALHLLRWHSVLSFDEMVRLTAEWYKAYYSGNTNMYRFSLEQIQYYISAAAKQNLSWVIQGLKA